MKINKLSFNNKVATTVRLYEHKLVTTSIMIISFFIMMTFMVSDIYATEKVEIFEKMGVVRLKETYDAPSFMLSDLEGNEISLDKFQGKMVMLNFWATW